MIKSFSHKGLKAFFISGSKSGIQAAHANRLRLQLAKLDSSSIPEDMGLPGWKLHPLKGDKKGHWKMHNPPHPGEVLRDGVFADSTISVTDFAQRLGVTRVTLSRMLNGKAGISADMALRLAAALGGTAQSWLHMQANYDLWQAEKSLRREVAKIMPLKLAA
jgi:antitoxin HigA-1